MAKNNKKDKKEKAAKIIKKQSLEKKEEVVFNEIEEIDEVVPVIVEEELSTDTDIEPVNDFMAIEEETVTSETEPEIETDLEVVDEILKEEPKPKVVKRIFNSLNNMYETVPLKPMKRNPKNIFFKSKKAIKLPIE